MSDNPSISVYKHGSKEDYLLLRHAPHHRMFGNLVHISAEQFRNGGLNLILADLQEYAHRDSEHGSVLDGFSPEAKKTRKLLREYDEVFVSLDSESVLSLGPFCVTSRSGDSKVVCKQDVVLVSLPCSNDAFYQKLMGAFEKCCYLGGV